MPARFAAVFVGGMAGTLLRLMLDLAMPHEPTGFPVSTLIANVLGSGVLGLLVGAVWGRAGTPAWLRMGLGTGLLGSFTTFSALAGSVVSQSMAGDWMLVAGYVVSTLVLGTAAAWIGIATGNIVAARSTGHTP
ncbi:fluoride efflux transporter CrcB [Okibacterium endophyticum]